jgi:membrane-bound lytic murein transglycosylase F
MHGRLFPLALAILLIFAACSEEQKRKKKKIWRKHPHVLEKIVERGKIVAVTNTNPLGYFIYRGQPMGFQYDLSRKLAKELDVDLQIVIEEDIAQQMQMVKSGVADLVISGLTVTRKRKDEVSFSLPIISTRQVLIQRRESKESESPYIDQVTDLALKKVHVYPNSSFKDRMENLSDEIGEEIEIIEMDTLINAEELMEMVSTKEIDYAVLDEYAANFFLRYFPNLDISLKVSLEQGIAWAMHKNATELRDTVNAWIKQNHNRLEWAVIRSKYLKNNRLVHSRVSSDFHFNKSGQISVYDDLIKKYSAELKWDWTLLAAMIKAESNFVEDTVAWSGATGLMQVMPVTAGEFGVHGDSLVNPEENIKVGTRLIKSLLAFWAERVDTTDLRDFVLASYNIGSGHVLDAQRLASKKGWNSRRWIGNTEKAMKLLSKPEYYRQDMVRHGYCRGSEAYQYVRRVRDYYHNYLNFRNISE